jgi:hypothetical protein
MPLSKKARNRIVSKTQLGPVQFVATRGEIPCSLKQGFLRYLFDF